MITEKEALKIAKQYLEDRKREYLKINEDRIKFIEDEKIAYPNNEYYEKKRKVYSISYDTESYQYSDLNFIIIDAVSSEVICTVSKHGYIENWEEDEEGNLLE